MFYIAIISGLTKGLNQGDKLRKKRPLATVQGPLANTQKKLEKWWWIRMRMAEPKPWITRK